MFKWLMGHHVKDCAPEIHELNFGINLAMKAVLAWVEADYSIRST